MLRKYESFFFLVTFYLFSFLLSSSRTLLSSFILLPSHSFPLFPVLFFLLVLIFSLSYSILLLPFLFLSVSSPCSYSSSYFHSLHYLPLTSRLHPFFRRLPLPFPLFFFLVLLFTLPVLVLLLLFSLFLVLLIFCLLKPVLRLHIRYFWYTVQV